MTNWYKACPILKTPSGYSRSGIEVYRLFKVSLMYLSLSLILLGHAMADTSSDNLQFVIDDQVVSDPADTMFDPEFDQVDGFFTWQDLQLKLWVGKVDQTTGELIPPNGRGQLIAQGLAPITTTGNGPEWVYSAGGQQIVFTKIIQGVYRLAVAKYIKGAWATQLLLKGQYRLAPGGSKDLNDPMPRIVYVIYSPDEVGPRWRKLNDPRSELRVPNDPSHPFFSTLVEGSDTLLFVGSNQNGVTQCSYYDMSTQIITPISFDAGNKKYGFMWRSPEFDNDWVAFCSKDTAFADELGVYRNFNNTWTKILALAPPSRKYFYSAEKFVYNGKSYIFFVTVDATPTLHEGDGDVWIAGIDPENPFYRQVSSSVPMMRRDPEVFITSQGPFIYYTEITKDHQGITHRCATGLGQPQ